MPTPRSRLLAPIVGLLLCAPISAQLTQIESLSPSGVPGNGDSFGPSVSADGRYVAFASAAFNLYWHDVNGAYDVFVRDRWTGSTELVSVSTDQSPGNGNSGLDRGPVISADGRYVVFVSAASNLCPGDTNGKWDVFVRDRRNSTTERVSVSTNGTQGNGDSRDASISADGRFVVFASMASNLAPEDPNPVEDVFLHDLQTGVTELVSVSAAGGPGISWSARPSVSADGRLVAFVSNAWDLLPVVSSVGPNVFVRDRQTGTNEMASVSTNGRQSDGMSFDASISADGRFVAFTSNAFNLVPGLQYGWKVFARDRQAGTTELVSVDSNGVPGYDSGATLPVCSISGDGRLVAFESVARKLVQGDSNGSEDVFVRDRLSGLTERVSVATDGTQGNDHSGNWGLSISADGRTVVFTSRASDLVPQDPYHVDVFARDRNATSFESLCTPGLDGVLGCPCSNPPAGSQRGCDNSAATGGAVLSATGVAYLSIDSLVFATTGERPAAFSALMQGSSLLANGAVYGQGVRCVGGAMKRLFTKIASGGSITAPEFAAGDATVSARSAALGDVIQPGQTRWYLVNYRDPAVLGGCPAGFTFNATQTGAVTWWP